MRAIAAIASAAAVACGSGSSTPGSGSGDARNVQPIVVNSGINRNYPNGVFTSVTVCVPGTSNCQTVDNILVDTGSIGLRLVASGAAGGALRLALPQQNAADGNPLAECTQFLDGYIWGPIRLADVTLAGEQARNVPVQVVGESAFASQVPTTCTGTGLVEEDSVATLDANGILGVGEWRQDCGSACTVGTDPNLYYSCSGSCAAVTASLTAQVQNPVWMFPTDNNGVIVQLPSIPAAGASSVSGSLVFGIGTTGNNGLGNATVLTLDGYGNFTTAFAGGTYSASFIDTGSNGLFFPSILPVCADQKDFYCPSTPQSFTAVNSGGARSAQVPFTIANFDTLASANFAFADVGGPNNGGFDWGLPFFFGRNVYVGIEGQSTPAGAGPYFAW